MGLFIKQDEGRSELQQKIAADIAERQRAREGRDSAGPDGVDDSRLVEGTSRLSRVGVILVLIAVVGAILVIAFAAHPMDP